jgi:phosphoadenosine phosphosulfate reductase
MFARLSAAPAVATSFQLSGMAILHMLRLTAPNVPVLFLDTGFHFPQTIEFRDRIAREWDINLVNLTGAHRSAERQAEIYGPALYRSRADLCCHINKVEPLQNALAHRDAWVSGVRRDQSAIRSDTEVAEIQTLDSGRAIVKVNPLAHWSRSDVEAYVRDNDIPTHPLLDDGYPSVGCWPCTRRVAAGAPERSGRWDGIEKTECGIHTFGRASRDES